MHDECLLDGTLRDAGPLEPPDPHYENLTSDPVTQ
jgi:hypothetical protein